MDNRTDVTEDQQATPEHPPFQATSGGEALGIQAAANKEQSNGAGLTAGPHNDPPQSVGIQDTYQAPARQQSALRWETVQQSVARYPWEIALSVVGLGLTVALLAMRRSRAR